MHLEACGGPGPHDGGNLRVVVADAGVQAVVVERGDGRDQDPGLGGCREDVVEERGEAAGCVGDILVLNDVIGADMEEDGLRVALLHPVDDVRIELVDAPAGVALVVMVAQGFGAVGLGADKVDGVSLLGELFPQFDSVASGAAESVGDRVSEGHDAHAAVGLMGGGAAVGVCDREGGRGQRDRSEQADQPSGSDGQRHLSPW